MSSHPSHLTEGPAPETLGRRAHPFMAVKATKHAGNADNSKPPGRPESAREEAEPSAPVGLCAPVTLSPGPSEQPHAPGRDKEYRGVGRGSRWDTLPPAQPRGGLGDTQCIQQRPGKATRQQRAELSRESRRHGPCTSSLKRSLKRLEVT